MGDTLQEPPAVELSGSLRVVDDMRTLLDGGAANLPDLQRHIPGDESSLLVVPLSAGAGAASVYPFGACTSSYTYCGVEHLSQRADCKWDGSKGLAAGIPHCFPMFGPADGRTCWTGPQHGFARNSHWKIVSRTASAVSLRLTLDDVAESQRSGWHWPFTIDYTVALSACGAELKCAMTVRNTGVETFDFTAALHSYLACSDCDAVTVHGPFRGSLFADKLDKVDGVPREKPEERAAITLATAEGDGHEPYDRVYIGVTGDLTVHDSAPTKPGVHLSHSVGWQDTTLWNPRGNEAQGFRDFCVWRLCA